MQFSVIVPIYNEAEALVRFHAALQPVVEKLPADYEIIYVNDGSGDDSLGILKALQKQFLEIRIISFARNRGKSAALCAGFSAARGRWLIMLDGDGQNPPEEILRLIAFRQEYDLIIGVRQQRKDAFLRKFSSATAKFSRKLVLGDTTLDTGCALRVFKREVLEHFPFFRNFHRFFTYLVKLRGFSVKEVPVAHQERIAGVTKYKTFKRLSEGIVDLWGVFWLRRRLIRYEITDKS